MQVLATQKLWSKRQVAIALILAIAAFSWPANARIVLPSSPLNGPVGFSYDSESKLTSVDTAENRAEANIGANIPSKTKAVLLSLLVPGSGHIYLGEKGRGEVFLGAEVISWIGFAAFRISGKWKEDDYIRYAGEHAGIEPTGKNAEFYKMLTFYNSREEYNRAGRVYDPGRPYYPNTRSYYWQWDSDASRAAYRSLRNSSETAYRNATFMIGIAVLNRIVAGIDSFRLARKIASRSTDEFGSVNKLKVKFHANPFGSNPKVNITVSRLF